MNLSLISVLGDQENFLMDWEGVLHSVTAIEAAHLAKGQDPVQMLSFLQQTLLSEKPFLLSQPFQA